MAKDPGEPLFGLGPIDHVLTPPLRHPFFLRQQSNHERRHKPSRRQRRRRRKAKARRKRNNRTTSKSLTGRRRMRRNHETRIDPLHSHEAHPRASRREGRSDRRLTMRSKVTRKQTRKNARNGYARMNPPNQATRRSSENRVRRTELDQVKAFRSPVETAWEISTTLPQTATASRCSARTLKTRTRNVPFERAPLTRS